MKRILLVTTLLLLLILGFRVAREFGRTELPVLGAVPAFQLTAADGRPFGSADLEGSPWIATFIYTTCPGPCPRVVEAIAAVDHRLSRDPRIRLVSISVDPEADTPDVLSVYAANRGIDSGRWTFLTGETDTVYSLVRSGFLLAVERHDGKDAPDIDPVVHSTHAVLVDGLARVRGYYDTRDADAMSRLVRDARSLADNMRR
jgi:protein SCO1/2